MPLHGPTPKSQVMHPVRLLGNRVKAMIFEDSILTSLFPSSLPSYLSFPPTSRCFFSTSLQLSPPSVHFFILFFSPPRIRKREHASPINRFWCSVRYWGKILHCKELLRPPEQQFSGENNYRFPNEAFLHRSLFESCDCAQVMWQPSDNDIGCRHTFDTHGTQCIWHTT